jgi:ribosomal protein L40E
MTNTLPLGIFGCGLFGLLMILKSYRIFVPLKKNSYAQAIFCPSCGALVAEDAEVCEKCKQKLENQP